MSATTKATILAAGAVCCLLLVLAVWVFAQDQDAERGTPIEVREFKLGDDSTCFTCIKDGKTLFFVRDSNNDGEPNQILIGDPANRSSTRFEAFLNEKGLNLVECFDGAGNLLWRGQDMPVGPDRVFDGRLNEILVFEGEQVVREEYDEDGDGRPDSVKYWASDGKPLWEERFWTSGLPMDRIHYVEGEKAIREFWRKDGAALYYRSRFQGGVERVRECDTDGDGRIDKIQRFDDKGALIVEELDTNGDGWLDEKKDIKPAE